MLNTLFAVPASAQAQAVIFNGALLPPAAVAQLQAASAHADANQLIAWLRAMPEAPEQVYVVHGERNASDALRRRIKHELGWRAIVPEHGSTWPT